MKTRSVCVLVALLLVTLLAVAQETISSNFSVLPPGTITGSGTKGHISKFTGTTTIGNSEIFETSGGNVGIGTTTPVAKLDVKGHQNVTGTITATGAVTGSSFNIGNHAFAFGSYSNQNAFLGFSGNSTTTGFGNAASGYVALHSNTAGNGNTASGYEALYSNTDGGGNTASGFEVLYSNTTGQYNTASGAIALSANTTGQFNTATGSGVLSSNTTGDVNTASGQNALYSNTTGNGNTASGYAALYYNATGGYNTALGYNAGPDLNSPNLTNSTAIGAGAVVSESNALVLGGTGSYAVKVGIGTATPANAFTIAQGIGHAIGDGWDTYSSRRWKANIQTIHGALEKVQQLRGVSYNLRSNGKHEVGVIAEEVGAVVPEIVSWDEKGKDAEGVDYGRLTALLIEATKEQQTLIQQQQTQIRRQQAKILRLASQVRAIRASLDKNSPGASQVRTLKAQVTVVHQ